MASGEERVQGMYFRMRNLRMLAENQGPRVGKKICQRGKFIEQSQSGNGGWGQTLNSQGGGVFMGINPLTEKAG